MHASTHPNAFSAEKAVSAVVAYKVRLKIFFNETRLRHKETLNGLYQVKGFEQKLKSLNGVNNVNMHTI